MKLIKKAFIPFKIRSINYFMYAPLKIIRRKKDNRTFPVNYKYIKYYNNCKKHIGIFFPYKKNRPGKKRFVYITFYKKKKLYDKQNFIGGCKPILDILKKLNYIRDDNEKWIEVFYKQILINKKNKKREGFILEIYEKEEKNNGTTWFG